MRVWTLALLLIAPAAGQVGNPDGMYHTPATLPATLQEIQDTNPDFISVCSIGQSVMGAPLHVVDIRSPDLRLSVRDPQVLYLDGNHHGNEYLAAESVLIFLQELADWSLTEEGAERLSEVRVVATPMVNPDGTQADRRMNTNLVDLNRNYPFHWGLYGTSGEPGGFTYRGPAPASEPETQANVAFMEAVRPDIYLSMHTGSHDIVLPWRADEDGEYPDWDLYEHFLSGVRNVSGLDYRDPSGAGESTSWAYGALGALSIIVEVDEEQFLPGSAEEIPERMKEEVDIYWYALDNVEKAGGNLEIQNNTITNTGWASAYNITWYPPQNTGAPGEPGDCGAGGGLLGGSSGAPALATFPEPPSENGTLIATELAPGASMPMPQDGLVGYERRLQGADQKAMGWLDVQGQDIAAGPPEESPLDWVLPVAAVALAGVAVRLRRA